jgi:hypothetical protein
MASCMCRACSQRPRTCMQVEEDISKLKECVARELEDLKISVSVSDDDVHEMCRFGASVRAEHYILLDGAWTTTAVNTTTHLDHHQPPPLLNSHPTRSPLLTTIIGDHLNHHHHYHHHHHHHAPPLTIATATTHQVLHSVASLIGGVSSQEVVKLVTHQYAPLNSIFVYNGISSNCAQIQL